MEDVEVEEKEEQRHPAKDEERVRQRALPAVQSGEQDQRRAQGHEEIEE